MCLCETAQKTVLIVYAHQSPGSFNAAVRDVAVQELTEQGFRVVVSDLYAMNFRASATQDDIIGLSVSQHLLTFHLCLWSSGPSPGHATRTVKCIGANYVVGDSFRLWIIHI